MRMKTGFAKLLAAAALLALPCGTASAQVTLKAVMHSDVKIVDPIWTTAYITRNHGYMIYDTLFAMDEKGEIKPQMVDKYDVSADKLTYTFTLRDGLALARRRAGHGRGLRRLDQALGRGLARPEGDELRRHDHGRRRRRPSRSSSRSRPAFSSSRSASPRRTCRS